jgi:hypothetical protein
LECNSSTPQARTAPMLLRGHAAVMIGMQLVDSTNTHRPDVITRPRRGDDWSADRGLHKLASERRSMTQKKGDMHLLPTRLLSGLLSFGRLPPAPAATQDVRCSAILGCRPRLCLLLLLL